MNWAEQAANSHYQTAVAIRDQLHVGNVQNAERGIEELIDALSRSERRALRSQMIRLMAHVIKWQCQPAKRSESWVATILDARAEIRDIQEETPSLTDDVIRATWDSCVHRAMIAARADMGEKPTVKALTWSEVFEQNYSL